MSGPLLNLALAVAMQVGTPAPYESPNYPPMQNAFSQHGFEGQFEVRHPYDIQQNWVHGYYQDIPAYGGFAHYRPYNYKDVLSQGQTSGGWGMNPQMPYSQQFWHRYQDAGSLLKYSQYQPLPGYGPAQSYPFSPANPGVMAMPAGWGQPTQANPIAPMPGNPVMIPRMQTARPAAAPVESATPALPQVTPGYDPNPFLRAPNEASSPSFVVPQAYRR